MVKNSYYNLGELQNERNSLKTKVEEQKQEKNLLQNSLGEIKKQLITPESNIPNSSESQMFIKTVTFGENGEEIRTVEFI